MFESHGIVNLNCQFVCLNRYGIVDLKSHGGMFELYANAWYCWFESLDRYV